jgi:signal transduction histidine kinase
MAMASWLQSLVASRSSDPRERRREMTLYILSLSAVAVSFVWLLIGLVAIWLMGPYPQFFGDLILGLEGVVFQGGAYLIGRCGFLKAAAYVSLFALLIMPLSSMLWIWRNPLDPTFVFYAVGITVAGLILGRRAAAAFALCSVLSYMATALWLFAQGFNWIRITWGGTVILIGISLTAELGILILVVHFYIRSMEHALRDAEELARERTHELRDAYSNLAQQHARLEVILRNIADGLVVTDPQDQVVLANPVFGRIVSQALPALAGRRLGETVDAASLVRIVRHAREKPGMAFMANVTVAKRVYQAVACALGDAEDALSGVVTVLHDITQEIATIEARTQFVSSVAHELRVPLASIRGYADLLLDGGGMPLPPGHEAFVQIILRNVERMATLVYDLLDLCHLESGRVQMETEPVSLRTAVEEVVTTMRPQLTEKGHVLEVQLPDGLSFVLADPRRLNQVLTNLLSNACKYTPEGGRIAICAQPIPPPQSDLEHFPRPEAKYVQVTVQDTGVGIPPEDAERIFDHFVRLDNPAVGTAGGTGLGLTIVRQLLALQGGQVWVESAVGRGSTFYFSLPVAE